MFKQKMGRVQSIDIAKGICVILMMVGHCHGLPSTIHWQIESFHMPFFFIAGGYFFRIKPLKQVFATGFKRLIMPLIIGVAVCVGVMCLFQNERGALSLLKALLYPGGTKGKDWIAPNWPDVGALWFLAALFWCRILYSIINRYIYQHKLLLCALLSWGGGLCHHG